MSYILTDYVKYDFRKEDVNLPDWRGPMAEFIIKDNVIKLDLDAYPWDGLTWFPDGKNTLDIDDKGTYLPETWRGSLLHDICYLYLDTIQDFPLERKTCDHLLRIELNKIWPEPFPLIVYGGTRVFGRWANRSGNKYALSEKTWVTPGECVRVYNKKSKPQERRMHYYIWISHRGEMRPVRLTRNNLNVALRAAENNIEDIPSLYMD